jgi:hypothetical protein
MTEKFYITDDAADQVHLSPRTLEKWRITGDGPVYRKFGRKVLYAESDLRDWADAQRRTSTSDGQGRS